MGSDELLEMVFKASDNGEDVFVQFVDDTDVVEFVEVGDVVFENVFLREELELLFDGWSDVAEGVWRE